MANKNILFLSRECGFIDNFIYDKLVKEKFSVEYADLTSVYEHIKGLGLVKRFRIFFKLLLEMIKRANSYDFIICSPVDSWFLSQVFSLVISRPRKTVIIIPPSPKHIFGLLRLFKLYLFRFSLFLLGLLGVSTLLVFTTPYEKEYLETVIRSRNYIYIPLIEPRVSMVRELIYSDKPLIIISYDDWINDQVFHNALETFRELGVQVRYVIVSSKPIIHACNGNYNAICIISDDISEIIKHSTLVIVKRANPESNRILVEAIMNGRPVISSKKIGMAYIYSDTGLIVFLSKWALETFTDTVLKILNRIDYFKKVSLKNIPKPLKSDYGIYILIDFLEN
ncbi:glycosyltransferase family 1 protein [Staphylothermus hellenicus]|nr:glycosyltransferase family 1 protein [Staphylothermus hellenicus]